MNNNTKILIGFLSIVILILIQMSITYKLQNNFYDNTLLIKEVEVPLEILAEKGAGYDAIKTGIVYAALQFAQKGDYENAKMLKSNYYDPAVDGLISDFGNHQVETLVAQSQRSQEQKVKAIDFSHRLFENGVKINALETQAFEAIDKKDLNTAATILTGEEYGKYKIEIIQDAEDWQDLERKVTLSVRNNILKSSQQIIYLNLGISIVILIMVILTMLIIRSFVASRETALVKKEKELDIRDKMEKTYKTLFENATDAIFIADANTRQLVDCNESAEKLMGYSRAKILSMKADELHPKDKLKKTMEGFKKQAEGKIKSILTEVLTKDKKRIPVKINASAIKIGKKTYSQGMFRELK